MSKRKLEEEEVEYDSSLSTLDDNEDANSCTSSTSTNSSTDASTGKHYIEFHFDNILCMGHVYNEGLVYGICIQRRPCVWDMYTMKALCMGHVYSEYSE